MGGCCSSGVSAVGSKARERYNTETADAGRQLLQLGTSKGTMGEVMKLYKRQGCWHSHFSPRHSQHIQRTSACAHGACNQPVTREYQP
jgi:hypothetical protein